MLALKAANPPVGPPGDAEQESLAAEINRFKLPPAPDDISVNIPTTPELRVVGENYVVRPAPPPANPNP